MRSATAGPTMLAVLTSALLLFGCGRDDRQEGVDPTTVDQQVPSGRHPPAPTTPITLPSGTTVHATPVTVELHRYLQSAEPAGRRFDFDALRFVDRSKVRQDPNLALTSLVTVLNEYPRAQVRIEVAEMNPQVAEPRERAEERAAAIERALVNNGLDASRVTSQGVKRAEPGAPEAYLVVTQK